MTKQDLLKIKKLMVLGAMGTTMALTGCQNKQDIANNSEETAIENQIVPEENTEIKERANKIYNEFKEYCDARTITPVELEKVIYFVNGEYDKLSYDDVMAVEDIMKDFIYPYNLSTVINEEYLENANGIDYNSVEHTTLLKAPRMSDFVADEDPAKQEFVKMEEIREDIMEAAESGHIITEDETTTYNEKIVRLFNSPILSGRTTNGNYDEMGKNLALMYGYKGILSAASEANKEKIYITGASDEIDIATGKPAEMKVNHLPEEYVAILISEDIKNKGLSDDIPNDQPLSLINGDDFDAEVTFNGQTMKISEMTYGQLQAYILRVKETMLYYEYDPCVYEKEIDKIYGIETSELSTDKTKVNSPKLTKRA